jgi:hypothetical protein
MCSLFSPQCNRLLSLPDYGYTSARSPELHESISRNIRAGVGGLTEKSLCSLIQKSFTVSTKLQTLPPRCDTYTWHLCQQHNVDELPSILTAFPSALSSCMRVLHFSQRHINTRKPIHSTCMPINCQPITCADVSTYQLLLSHSPSP